MRKISQRQRAEREGMINSPQGKLISVSIFSFDQDRQDVMDAHQIGDEHTLAATFAKVR